MNVLESIHRRVKPRIKTATKLLQSLQVAKGNEKHLTFQSHVPAPFLTPTLRKLYNKCYTIWTEFVTNFLPKGSKMLESFLQLGF